MSPEARRGQTEKRTNERTNERTNKSPPVFYRTSSPLGPLPKKGCLTNLTKNKVPEFSSDFGDLSPVDALRGPKTPSNRQVLRLFLFLFLAGNLLQSAAELVVKQVLRKHKTHVCKTERRLQDDVKVLYTEATHTHTHTHAHTEILKEL